MSAVHILARQSLHLYHGVPMVPFYSSLLSTRTILPQTPSLRLQPSPFHHKTYSTTTTTPSSVSTSPSSPPQNEYLIIIPDHPNASAARTKAQPGHITAATPLIDAGIITYCGVTLADIAEGEAKEKSGGGINGSVIVMKVGSEREVREFLERDEYTRGGVWDVERVRIWGVRSG